MSKRVIVDDLTGVYEENGRLVWPSFGVLGPPEDNTVIITREKFEHMVKIIVKLSSELDKNDLCPPTSDSLTCTIPCKECWCEWAEAEPV